LSSHFLIDHAGGVCACVSSGAMFWVRSRFELVDVSAETVHRKAEFVACIDDDHSRTCDDFWLNHAIESAFCQSDMESNKDLR
jgi:hypothetical protein